MKEVGLILKKLGESNGLEMALDENGACTLELSDGRVMLVQERSDSHDAYKLAARLAVLSQLIGKVPCWNCKSGKDRTGEMDVECKFLAALIARGEPIPAPGAKLTAEQKGLFRAIALQGGNFEVQKQNVGVAGFMSGSVASIAERLGGRAYHAVHRGGADHVAK